MFELTNFLVWRYEAIEDGSRELQEAIDDELSNY